MRTCLHLLVALALATLIGCTSNMSHHASADSRQVLMDLERESHQRWFEQDLDALDRIFGEDFHLVVMSGVVETRAQIIGSGTRDNSRPNALQVRSLRTEPEEVLLDGDTGVVISTLHLDATFRGQPLGYDRMRVMSVFKEKQGGWRLMARSMTPMRGPPRTGRTPPDAG